MLLQNMYPGGGSHTINLHVHVLPVGRLCFSLGSRDDRCAGRMAHLPAQGLQGEASSHHCWCRGTDLLFLFCLPVSDRALPS